MIIVHHLDNSRSQKILWLLEELGLPYEIKHYKRDPETMQAPPALKAVHPLGKSPLISDGDLVIAESGAIVEYLVDKYASDRLRPDLGSRDYHRYKFWMHYSEGSVMPVLLVKLIFDRIDEQKVPFFVKPVVKALVGKIRSAFIDPQLALHLGFIEAQLAQGPWLLGDRLTGADFQMVFTLEAAAQGGGLDATRYPKLTAYLARIYARPAYTRGIERGGPYAYKAEV